MRWNGPIPVVLVLLLSAGCSGDGKPQGEGAVSPSSASNRNPPSETAPNARVRSLTIQPGEVYRGSPVRLSADGASPAPAQVQWLGNGTAAAPSLGTGGVRRGDTVQARYSSSAGVVDSQIVSVRNSPPEIRGVWFAPPDRRSGSPLGVEADAYDADDDPVRLEIAWIKNGEPAGEGERLPVPARGGDRILVTITPFDGETRGRGVTLSRVIRNTVLIEGNDGVQADGNVLTFRILASGDAGTPLAYSLKEAPPGMRIDPATGRVRWETPPGTTGNVPFVVMVSDGAGAETTARFTVTVREDDASGPR